MKKNRKFFLIGILLVGIGSMSIVIYQNEPAANFIPLPEPAAISSTSSPTSTGLNIIPATNTPDIMPASTPAETPLPMIIVKPQSALAYQFGMSIGQTLLNANATRINDELNDIASLGIGWIRFDIQWDSVQPKNAQTFNWSGIDRLITAANAHSIKVLPILDYTPFWARTPSCASRSDACPPENPALFAAFAKAAAERYTPQGVTDWEIWNEPNLRGSWGSAYGTAGYVALLKDSYLAIKSVNPSATVITGGLGPAADENGAIAPLTFLRELYADGAKSYFDAIGFHPYSSPALPSNYQSWNAWSQMASTTPSFRSIMIANGDADKPIWMTEYGAATDGPGVLAIRGDGNNFSGSPDHVTEALQSEMYAQAIIGAENFPWAGPLFFYSYKDLGISESDRENFFGIIRYDGTLKPAYSTVQLLLTGK
jgi:hypothetical protein